MTQEKNQHPNEDEQHPVNQHSVLPTSDAAVSADTATARYSQNSPVQNNGFHTESHVQMPDRGVSNGVGESPDLLRWRAESLLDEMMIGGADGSATQNAAPYTSGTQNSDSVYSTSNGQSQSNASANYYDTAMADYGEGPAHDGRPRPEPLPSENPPAAPQSGYTNYQGEPSPTAGVDESVTSIEYDSAPEHGLNEHGLNEHGLNEHGLNEPAQSPAQPGAQHNHADRANYTADIDDQNHLPSLSQQPSPQAGEAPATNPLIGNQAPYNQSAHNQSAHNQSAYDGDAYTETAHNQNIPQQYADQHSAGSNPQSQNVQNQAGPNQHTPSQPPLDQRAYEQNAYSQNVPAQNAYNQNAYDQNAYDQSTLGQSPSGPYPQEQRPPNVGNLRQPTAAHLAAPSSASAPAASGGQMSPSSPAHQEPAYGGEHSSGSHPPQGNQAPAGNQPSNQPPQGQPLMGQSPTGQPAEWANRPSFEQGYSPQPNSGHQNVNYAQGGYPQSGYPNMGGGQQMGQNRGPQERNQQPLDPATYYAQQIAWRRELERKQWAISSGSSSDYLTSVPRYEEAQNRTASYMDRMGAQTSWQQNDGYNARYPNDGYAPNGYGQNPSAYSQGGIHANPNYSPQLGPVNPGYGNNPGYGGGQQQRNMPFAERMDVGAQAQRHSNLLPRRSQMSIDALYEEMTVLQAQVDAALPIYGDSADRALHLLEKGRSILEQNPERSAEVAYYVQQVSGIIQRGQQRVEWSNLYRDRLSRYLSAWLFMGVLGLIGSMAYGDTVANALSSAFPAVSGFFTTHIPSILLALAASIIGTAGAALANMWRHSQKEYGFFDRKYGLLGVVLPLMGLIVAFVIYAVMAIIYLFLNVSPDTSWLAHILPALFALIYGSSQEKIYGTSE